MDFRRDANGDLDLTNGKAILLRGADAIRNHIDIRAGIAKGEWYQDLRIGIPLYEEVLASGDNVDLVVAIYRDMVRTTPGVASVVSMNFAFDAKTQSLSLFGRAKTVAGDEVPFDFSEFIR